VYKGYANWDTFYTDSWAENNELMYKRGQALMAKFLRRQENGTYDHVWAQKRIKHYFWEVHKVARVNGDMVDVTKIDWAELEGIFFDRFAEYVRYNSK